MSKPEFVVPVADFEAGPRKVSWPIPLEWLEHTLEGTFAKPRGPGKVDVELSKSGREVLVRGRVLAQVTMPCVVTLDPLEFDLNPELFLMLTPAAGSQSAVRARRKGAPHGPAAAGPTGKAAPRPLKAAPERSGKSNTGWAEDPELTDADAARDTFDGEKVVLDEFVREFILLELPMYPRRSDLPQEESAAIAPASQSSGSASSSIDPRLLPLAELANRLREKKE